MYHTLKTNSLHNSFIHLQTTQQHTHKLPSEKDKYRLKQSRSLSIIGSEDYKRSLRRSFTRAKLLAFFNPDLKYFITFTYKENQLDENLTLKHIKLFLQTEKRILKNKNKKRQEQRLRTPGETSSHLSTTKLEFSTFPHPKTKKNYNTLLEVTRKNKRKKKLAVGGVCNVENSATPNISYNQYASVLEAATVSEENPIKYIYVFERQKRGAIHVHMISNTPFTTFKNKNGYPSLTNWPHGFTSVLSINDMDENFKPYLYLFKYMGKAQRIGKSFIHTSKTFDKIHNVDYDDFIPELNGGDLIYNENYEYTHQSQTHRLARSYYRR